MFLSMINRDINHCILFCNLCLKLSMPIFLRCQPYSLHRNSSPDIFIDCLLCRHILPIQTTLSAFFPCKLQYSLQIGIIFSRQELDNLCILSIRTIFYQILPIRMCLLHKSYDESYCFIIFFRQSPHSFDQNQTFPIYLINHYIISKLKCAATDFFPNVNSHILWRKAGYSIYSFDYN